MEAHQLPIMNASTLPAIEVDDPWQRLPVEKRKVATNCAKVVKEVLAIMKEDGLSKRPAIELLIMRLEAEHNVSKALIEVAQSLGKKGAMPSYSTVNRWVTKYNKQGLIGLAPAHKGSARKDYGWEVRAMHLYATPSKPSVSAVARKLQREGFDDASEPAVRRFLMNLPADKGAMSRKRLGTRLYDNTQKTFNRRSTENMPVGTCYQGDGHTLDLYLEHPTGNKAWRAELTLWIDVTSRYVVGWWLSEAESAHSTLFGLSHAVLTHDHIPAILHIDNGSGYKNKMLADESTGFYNRLGIDVMHSLPYNAKAKGQVERFFGTMERDFNKWFPSYCGADMADEAKQLLLKRHKKGEISLPTAEQWMAEFTKWLAHYHNTPHNGIDGKTPGELWATLEPHRLEMKSAAIFWPRVNRTVKRQAITLEGREYMAAELVQYNNKKLIVEYSLHNDSLVRVLDSKERWICDATLVNKKDYLPESRIEEAKQKRLTSSIKRLDVHADEKRKRAGLAVTHEHVLENISALEQSPPSNLQQKTGTEVPAFDVPGEQAESEINIDPFDTDY